MDLIALLPEMSRVLTPIRLLVLGYIVIVLAGAFCLTLPASSSKGVRQPFIDALFMASSSIATCGLVVVDIGTYYSVIGQAIILLMFQIGGMGYMAFFIFIAYALRQKLSVNHRVVARESVSGALMGNIRSFFGAVIVFTFIFEFLGASALYLCWMRDFPAVRAVYLGVFHSVSAFCTAGMSLFPDGLMAYGNSVAINVIVDILSLVGAIGFFVLYDLCLFAKKCIRREFPRRLSLHSKVAILFSSIVILIGAVVIFISEKWPDSSNLGDRVKLASFQAISASTTDGFNTMDIGSMSVTSLFMIIMLMFVGASPGSTGGGIKTTTLAIILFSIWAHVRNKEDVNMFHKRIPMATVNKAFVVFIGFLFVLIIDILVLSATEEGSFLQILFEITSALGNTGLSTGITSRLTAVGKIFITITMFIGRIGPLTAGLFLVGNSRRVSIKYPEGEVFVA